ncbi:TPA: hypothetical protein KKX05_002745 [Legionella pneumophila]|nr:hypothetical protein [Legionella pneumophila]HAT7956392.1 hypothetical protein [Legionella pneumophila]HAU1384770.1 hypothetical protein [Legionella pneumophila]HAU2065923.1 hypothetical protein [Legionella pneumophila]HBD7206058.1 hypothetical protein [Legionella pneumophila]|tara:strand:+ start:16 stop:342 length:327 start_codon:yes stop_codon:yes gene_type:complete
MLKKLSRFLIVAVIQLTVLVIVLFLLAPYLLDSMKGMAGIAITLKNTKILSFLIRILVYSTLFFAWPHITKKLIQNPSAEMLKQINKARFVFIGALLSIEILYWVGQL